MKISTMIRSLTLPATLFALAGLSSPAYAACAGYRLSAFGGDAGFRVMNNPGDFRRVSNGSVRGEVCGGGRVTVELSKRQPGTHVALDIGGREYTFGQGDRGSKVENHWFRRYYTIDIPGGRDRPRHPGKDSGYNHGPDRYYSDHGRGGGHGYGGRHRNQGNNHYYGGQGYGGHGYDGQGYGNQDWRHGQIPRYRVGTENHRRAHRKGIPHDHFGDGYAWH